MTTVNSTGVVVGTVDYDLGGGFASSYAFVWQAGAFTKLAPAIAGVKGSISSTLSPSGNVGGGWLDTNYDLHAFAWSGGIVRDLATTGVAEAVDAMGRSVGYIRTGGAVDFPCLWRADGTRADLPVPPDSQSGLAYAMDEAGHAVGSWRDALAEHAALWDISATPIARTDLPLPAGGKDGVAIGIEQDGSILGFFTGADGHQHGAVWTLGQTGTVLDVFPPGENLKYAAIITRCTDGRILLGTDSIDDHAGTYILQQGAYTSLLPPGAVDCAVMSANAKGQSVGYYFAPNWVGHPVHWEGAIPIDLEPLLPSDAVPGQTSASAINATGTIAGTYKTTDGLRHIYLLVPKDGPAPTITPTPTPVPEKPTIQISGRQKIVTAKTSVVVKGTATGPIVKITAKLGRKTLKVQGTNSWSLRVKGLKPGGNKITITVVDARGSSAATKLIIVSKMP